MSWINHSKTTTACCSIHATLGKIGCSKNGMYSHFQNVILIYCCIGGQGQGQSNSPFLTLDWQQALRRDRLLCKVQVRHVLLDWLAVGYPSPCGLMVHLYFSSTFIRQWRDANKSYYWFWHSSDREKHQQNKSFGKSIFWSRDTEFGQSANERW